VEDEAVIAMAEERTLGEHGFRVTTTVSGEAALEEVANNRDIDLVLMDIDLGDQPDGTVVAEEILRLRELPVVFLTSHSEKEMVERVRKVTRYGYVLKSSGEFVLIEAVRMALELFATHKELERSRDLYESVAQLTGEVITRHDASGRWIFVNEEAKRVWGISEKDIREARYLDFVHPDDRRKTQEAGERMAAGHERVFGLVNRQWTTEGWRTYEWNSAPVLDEEGTYLGFQAGGRDITERERARQELLLKERALQTATNGVVMVNPDGKIFYVNAAAVRMWGYDTSEELIGLPVSKLWAAEAAAVELFSRVWAGQNLVDVVEATRPDGESFSCLLSASGVTDEEGRVISLMASFADISEQKLTEEELRREQQLVSQINEMSPVAILKFNADGHIVYANQRAEQVLGRSREALQSRTFDDPDWKLTTLDGKPYPQEELPFALVKDTRTPVFDIKHGIEWPNGECRILSINAAPLFGPDGSFEGVLVAAEEITKRVRIEREKSAAIAAQNRLFTELNHRVKNNLAMVSSLINLKNNALGDQVDLSDIRNQVNAIALLHEKLYRTNLITDVDLGPYLKDLLVEVFSLYVSGPVSVHVDVDGITLCTKKATSLGLIINELATNAMKHAFVEAESPEFSVSMVRVGAHYLLRVSNNGGPLPEQLSLGKEGAFGLQLVSALVAEIDGELEIEREPRTTFTIRLPVEESPSPT
jgi:PAS domain S-box-containing protein